MTRGPDRPTHPAVLVALLLPLLALALAVIVLATVRPVLHVSSWCLERRRIQYQAVHDEVRWRGRMAVLRARIADLQRKGA